MSMQPDKPKLSLQSGANLTQLKKDIKKITDGINTQKKKRQEINDQIASYRAKLETMGIHKRAADMAMAYMSWEPEKREGFDIAYAIVREAMGLPVSDDLFAAADEREQEEKKREQQAEADSVFAGRREEQVADVTERELQDGGAIFDEATARREAEAQAGAPGEPEGVGLDGQAVSLPKGQTERPEDEF